MKKTTVIISILALGLSISSYASKVVSSNQPPQKQCEDPKDNKKAPPSGAELIAEMDENGDGKLSKNEIKGPLANDFDTVDTDGDGYLTEEEIDNAPKPKKPPRGK